MVTPFTVYPVYLPGDRRCITPIKYGLWRKLASVAQVMFLFTQRMIMIVIRLAQNILANLAHGPAAILHQSYQSLNHSA